MSFVEIITNTTFLPHCNHMDRGQLHDTALNVA